MNKAFLIILDGWGINPDKKVSAVSSANTSYVDSLFRNYPNAQLTTYGSDVGLPAGQMGNSEVGHLNIGAGRVVYQELMRINKAIEDGHLFTEQRIVEAVNRAKLEQKPIHLMGLLSDGGVHAHIDHIIALAKHFANEGIQVYIHAFLDGRDTGPTSGVLYLEQLLAAISSTTATLSTVIGRYYAMDRDNRWERIAQAYNLLLHGQGESVDDILSAVRQQYTQQVTDEFMPPLKVGSTEEGIIRPDDLVFFANFRTDRPRQLTQAITQKDIPEHGMKKISCHFVTMTEYDKTYKNVIPVYKNAPLPDTLGEVISKAGLTQLRVAETEKYPHVTHFFSGGREAAFDREERILVSSPKVATYDLAPEMSAYELTNKVHQAIEARSPDLIIMNYANADMVGHTGVFDAAVAAVETVDACLEALIPIALAADYGIIVIADHGNAEIMIKEDGSPHTAHTLSPVPVIVISSNPKYKQLKSGRLADIAPSLLDLIGIEPPEAMDGQSLMT